MIDVSQMSEQEARALQAALNKRLKEKELDQTLKKREWEDAKDAFVRSTISDAEAIRDILKGFKDKTMEKSEALQLQMLDLTGNPRASLNNYFFTSLDGSMKVEVSTHYTPVYDETFASGIAKIQEWIENELKEAKKSTAVIVQRLLMRNKKNEYQPNKLMELISLEQQINDPLFTSGCQIIEQSFKNGESVRYLLFKKKNENGKWEKVSLQFSAL